VTDDPKARGWIGATILVGVLYFLIGRFFTLPVEPVRLWRIAAWAISGVIFGAHLAYEHARVRSAPRAAALHATWAVALGAFGLAVAGMIRDAATHSGFRPTWLVALVAWPALLAVPAFVTALVVATVLARRTPRTGT
jgi:hypothetical protein